MKIQCSNCTAAFSISDQLLGSTQTIGAQCPYCGFVKVVRPADLEETLTLDTTSGGPHPNRAGPSKGPLDGPNLPCRVCGKQLRDEFDKVIGLCDVHQRQGVESGPRERDEKPHAHDVASTTLNVARERPAASASAQPRPFIAPVARSRRRLSGGVLGVLALFAVLGAAAYGVIRYPNEVRDSWRQIHTETSRRPARSSNPLRPLLDKWRALHRDLSGTSEEHALVARDHHLLDAWLAYARADEALQRALLLSEDDPSLIAAYAENLVIWKGHLLNASELRLIEAGLDFAAEEGPEESGVHRARAALELARGDLAGCRQHATRALELDGADGRAKLLLAHVFLEGNTELAVKEALEALRLEPKLRRADRLLVSAYLRIGRYGSAGRVLDERLKSDPKNAELHRLYGEMLAAIGHSVGALERFSTAQRGEGDTDAARLSEGALQLDLRRYSEAAEVYRKVMESPTAPDPYRADAAVGGALADMGRDRWNTAAQHLRRAVELAPRSAAALLGQAELALQADSATVAIDLAQRVLELRANEPAALVTLARAALRQGQKGQAIEWAERAVSADRYDLRLRGILAAIHLAAGGVDRAYALMRELEEMDPEQSAPPGSRGLMALSRVAQEEAAARFTKASADHRHDSLAHASAGVVLFHLGEKTRAREAIARALAADDSNVVARIYEAQLAREEGASLRAAEVAQSVLDFDRASAIAHLILGRSLMDQKKMAEATESVEAAVRSAPGLMVAQVELARLSLKGGDKDEVLEVLLRAFRLYPHILLSRRLLFEVGY